MMASAEGNTGFPVQDIIREPNRHIRLPPTPESLINQSPKKSVNKSMIQMATLRSMLIYICYRRRR